MRSMDNDISIRALEGIGSVLRDIGTDDPFTACRVALTITSSALMGVSLTVGDAFAVIAEEERAIAKQRDEAERAWSDPAAIARREAEMRENSAAQVLRLRNWMAAIRPKPVPCDPKPCAVCFGQVADCGQCSSCEAFEVGKDCPYYHALPRISTRETAHVGSAPWLILRRFAHVSEVGYSPFHYRYYLNIAGTWYALPGRIKDIVLRIGIDACCKP